MRVVKFNQTIWLLIILLGLGGVIWWLSATQETALNPKVILRLKPEQVTGIEISKANVAEKTDKIKLQFKDKKWNLITPVQDQADIDVLKSLLNVFDKLTVEETVIDPGSLSDYGLVHPNLKVKLLVKQRAAIEFLIGAETPIPSKYYAKFADKPEVYIVGSSVKSNLNQELKNLRHKQILSFDISKVQSINIYKQGDYSGQVQLKLKKGEWQMVTPYPEKVEPGKVTAMLESLSGLRADDFIDNGQDLQEYSFTQPEYWFELRLIKGQIITLKTSKVGDSYYVITNLDRPVFKLNSVSALSPLQFKPEEQIWKKMVEYPKSDIKVVRYRDENGLEKQLQGKQRDQILESLGNLTITGIHSSQNTGQPVWKNQFFQKPLYQMILELKDKSKQVVLTIYSTSTKEKYLIASNERPLIYEINASDLRMIFDKIKSGKY